MSTTTNLGLFKYEDNNNADLRFINSSMDKIDAEITGVKSSKQNKNDSGLNTTAKIITDAINELLGKINTNKSITDGQYSDLNSNKQNKNDNGLNTTSKVVIGAINEVLTKVNNNKSTSDGQYNGLNNTKQNITDNGLNTSAKNIVDSINEVLNKMNKYNNESQSQYNDLNLSKQSKSDNNLNTAAKTIVGAINELLSIIRFQIVSDGNGTYLKFDNGLLIYFYRSVRNINYSVGTSGVYVEVGMEADVINFPHSFINTPVVNLTIGGSAGITNRFISGKLCSISNTQCSVNTWSETGGSLDVTYNITAIGFWK